jgi:hypothetical protein
MFPVDKALALCDLYPDDIFVARITGLHSEYDLFSLPGNVMKGFLVPGIGELIEFSKFS